MAFELRRALRSSRRATRAEMERLYAHAIDPWQYASVAMDRERHSTALELIDRWRGDANPRALEVGCGEGLFTAALALRCSSVLGVDVSPTALKRAAERCAENPAVRFETWDATADPPPGRFELVTCMDLISSLPRITHKRRAIAAVRYCLEPGGLLVVTEIAKDALIEHARWARWLGVGATWVERSFAESSGLRQLESRRTTGHLVAIFALES
jgi:2-polyprenyl-3-methyl-5-hydroxy-6-metoxy-1,4-benzoquinol methylase